MSDTRYGFYLRPSVAMSRAQIEIHELLRRQYGLECAGKFMPHATVKGFFRSDAVVTTMIERLDIALRDHPPFMVYNNGLVEYGKSAFVLRIRDTPNGSRNQSLQSLHQSALDALMPLVHPECDFTPLEWFGERFDAHLTLAMADIDEQFFHEVSGFVGDAAPIGPSSFVADTFHLFAFTSAEWGGRWWETLRWELLHSWQLQENMTR